MNSSDGFPETTDEARTDIALTRDELAETAQALAHKMNVPERAKEQLQHRSVRAKEQLQDSSVRAKEQVQHSSAQAVHLLRQNELVMALAGALAALAVGGVITWRLKR